MSILLSTGNLNQSYEILDVIFTFDSHKAGLFRGKDPASAFNGVKENLKKKCTEIGGNAVINCQFEYRDAISEGVFGSKGVIEILAYGTVIKIKE